MGQRGTLVPFQDTVENTDGNYINMQIEEFPYYRKDEDAYLKIPGDNDDLENTFLPGIKKALYILTNINIKLISFNAI